MSDLLASNKKLSPIISTCTKLESCLLHLNIRSNVFVKTQVHLLICSIYSPCSLQFYCKECFLSISKTERSVHKNLKNEVCIHLPISFPVSQEICSFSLNNLGFTHEKTTETSKLGKKRCFQRTKNRWLEA